MRLLEQLHAAGCVARDDGDIVVPSFLPHHTVPPIRNWPGPRIVWNCISEQIAPYFRDPGHVPLLIGCDCSVVIGTAHALIGAGAPDLHVIYVDGDFDDAAPMSDKCQSAAAMAVWLLTNQSPFWSGAPVPASHVTVVGPSQPSQMPGSELKSVSLDVVRSLGARKAARRALESIPDGAQILLHFDIDVFRVQDLSAAYFPHAEGLTLAEGTELFAALASDPRVCLIEVSEYASLRDFNRDSVARLVEMIVQGLKR